MMESKNAEKRGRQTGGGKGTGTGTASQIDPMQDAVAKEIFDPKHPDGKQRIASFLNAVLSYENPKFTRIDGNDLKPYELTINLQNPEPKKHEKQRKRVEMDVCVSHPKSNKIFNIEIQNRDNSREQSNGIQFTIFALTLHACPAGTKWDSLPNPVGIWIVNQMYPFENDPYIQGKFEWTRSQQSQKASSRSSRRILEKLPPDEVMNRPPMIALKKLIDELIASDGEDPAPGDYLQLTHKITDPPSLIQVHVLQTNHWNRIPQGKLLRLWAKLFNRVKFEEADFDLQYMKYDDLLPIVEARRMLPRSLEKTPPSEYESMMRECLKTQGPEKFDELVKKVKESADEQQNLNIIENQNVEEVITPVDSLKRNPGDTCIESEVNEGQRPINHFDRTSRKRQHTDSVVIKSKICLYQCGDVSLNQPGPSNSKKPK